MKLLLMKSLQELRSKTYPAMAVATMAGDYRRPEFLSLLAGEIEEMTGTLGDGTPWKVTKDRLTVGGRSYPIHIREENDRDWSGIYLGTGELENKLRAELKEIERQRKSLLQQDGKLKPETHRAFYLLVETAERKFYAALDAEATSESPPEEII